MAYNATVIPVMIASPGDVLPERRIVRDTLHEWNYVHSLETQCVLMPVGWDTHSAPDLSGDPQDLINNRVLADCDILVGVFWTRLGTPTANASSGTAEEIQRHVAAGKLAMVYFSSKPVEPDAIEQEQYAALKDFRSWCRSRGLSEQFANEDEFRRKFGQQIQINLNQNPHVRSLFHSQAQTSEQANLARVSEEADRLISAAAGSDDGSITHIKSLAGEAIQAGSISFCEMDSPRETAKWKSALRELLSAAYIEQLGSDGFLYQVTQAGYKYADELAK